MRVLRNSPERQILIFSGFSNAARFGLIVAAFIILMSRFDVTPILAAAVGISLQGFVIATSQLSKKLFQYISLSTSQKLGATIGVITSFFLLSANNIVFFLLLTLISSFTKVAIEATFPRVTHSMIVANRDFASRLVGVQQGSFVVVCAIIAPIALSGSVLGPMIVVLIFYLIVLALALLFPACGIDSFEEVIQADGNQEKFDRRFGDIVKNENYRFTQSRIHRFRRTTSTLLAVDLFVNIIMSGSAMLMPLCFRDLSNLSQAFESIFAVSFGLTAGFSGLYLIPLLRRKMNFNQKLEWKIIAILLPIQFVCSILYSSFLGMYLAILSAASCGLLVTILMSIIQQVGARNLTTNQFQDFGCKLQQRNALARVVTPVVIAFVASVYGLTFAIGLLLVLAFVFSTAVISRIAFIIYSNRLDLSVLSLFESDTHSPEAKMRAIEMPKFSQPTSHSQLSDHFLSFDTS